MKDDQILELKKLFGKHSEIKLVYLFGSQATGKAGKMSDFDFAFYLDTKDKSKYFDLKLELIGKIARIIKNDKVDIVILNTTESPELKYFIIKDGKLIYSKEPYKLLVEPRILNEFFDFNTQLKKYNLTKV